MSAETDQKEREKAFRTSGGYEFNGGKLGPFTPQKQGIAADMGMRWPEQEEKDLIRRTHKVDGEDREFVTYRQAYKDSVFALWLCGRNETETDAAEINPEQARKDAWAWAEKIGFNRNTTLSGEGLGLWMQITYEINISKAEPQIKKKAAAKPKENPEEL